MLALLLLCASIPAVELPPAPPAAPAVPKLATDNLCGVWTIVPASPTSIRGTATISKAGELYYVQWAMVSENEKGITASTMQGVGIRQGDALAVSWREGAVQGVTLYRIEGKRLVGRWLSSPGDGVAQTETLQWLGRVPRLD